MRIIITTIALFFISMTTSFAQTPQYVEGTHYYKLRSPAQTENQSKIEVVEIFWYGSPNSNQLQPMLNTWEKSLPDDVNFIHLPAIFAGTVGEAMMSHAKIYYTAKSLGVTDDVHSAAYEAFHKKRAFLQSKSAIRNLFVTHGIDAGVFNKMYDSFGTRSAVQQASAKMRVYGAAGVPTMIVAGKYKVSMGSDVQTHANMLNVVDFLIAKERTLLSYR